MWLAINLRKWKTTREIPTITITITTTITTLCSQIQQMMHLPLLAQVRSLICQFKHSILKSKTLWMSLWIWNQTKFFSSSSNQHWSTNPRCIHNIKIKNTQQACDAQCWRCQASYFHILKVWRKWDSILKNYF